MFVYLEVHAYTIEIYCFITKYIALLYIMKVLTANKLYSRDTCTWGGFMRGSVIFYTKSQSWSLPSNVYTIPDNPNAASLEEKKKK
jgi:hypothetical protein